MGDGLFGARLRHARLALACRTGDDVQLKDIAAAIGVNYTTVYRWEREGGEPSDGAVKSRLAAALGVTAAWLDYGIGDAPAHGAAPHAPATPATPGKSGPIHMGADKPLVGPAQPAAATKHAAGTKRVR